MTKQELVIFDFDGTLVDTEPSYCEAAKYAAKTVFNEAISNKDALTYAYVLELTNDSQKALSAIGKNANKLKSLEFLERWAEAFHGPTAALLRPKNDSKEVLAAFAQTYLVAVVSQRHQSRNWLQKKLKELGLLDFVDCLVTRFDVKEGKPSPEGIFLARTELQATPVLMIGDSKNDVIAGQRAGITTIGVATGLTNHQELAAAGADTVVSTLTEVIDLLEANEQGSRWKTPAAFRER
jgi:HAD superfamily hydrolase (TIGR01509 family)